MSIYEKIYREICHVHHMVYLTFPWSGYKKTLRSMCHCSYKLFIGLNKVSRNIPIYTLCHYQFVAPNKNPRDICIQNNCTANRFARFIFLVYCYHCHSGRIVDGLVLDYSCSIAKALEWLQTCTKPSIWLSICYSIDMLSCRATLPIASVLTLRVTAPYR